MEKIDRIDEEKVTQLFPLSPIHLFVLFFQANLLLYLISCQICA